MLNNIFDKLCKISDPFISLMNRVGITPFGVSATSLCMFIIASLMIVLGNFYAGFIFLIIAFYFDAIDNYYARSYSLENIKFQMSDYFFDTVSEIAVIFSFFIVIYNFEMNSIVKGFILFLCIYELASISLISILDLKSRILNIRLTTLQNKRIYRLVLKIIFIFVAIFAGKSSIIAYTFASTILSTYILTESVSAILKYREQINDNK